MSSSSGRGRRVRPQLVVQVPLAAVVLGWLARGCRSALVAVAVRLRVLWLLLGAVGLAWIVWSHGSGWLPYMGVVVAFVLLGWRLASPGSFGTVAVAPVVGAGRRWRVYAPAWEHGMAACGLAVRHDGGHLYPQLLAVRSSRGVDLVRLRMLPGQVMADYAGAADRLAQTFGALDARVRSVAGRPSELVVWFLTRDPLVHPVAPGQPGESPDLFALPVGVREDGRRYRLRLLGSHLLVVGATGAGKSSVLWSLIHALATHLRNRVVELWVVDPKGGMELAAGTRLFTRFCHGDATGLGSSGGHELAYAELLEDAVALMRARQERLRGVARLHTPTPDEPLVLVVIDELAALTAYATDREAKKRIAAALSLLLSQGRAVGVLVVAALQDPRKEVLPARDLFPTRIGLRMTDADQVDMVLGDGARARGARCDHIPESLPGVGYVTVDGVAEPLRVRFCYLDDPNIGRLCEAYAPVRQQPATNGEAA